MADDTTGQDRLTAGAQVLLSEVERKREEGRHAALGLNHWLAALLERHPSMAEAMADETGRKLEAAVFLRQVAADLQAGKAGDAVDPESVLTKAIQHAKDRGKELAAERDIAVVVLQMADILPKESPRSATIINNSKPRASSEGEVYAPRAKRRTPTVEQFGRDLTREAMEGKSPPVIGRDDEIQSVIETLCRRTKRNPVLLGPPGVGKTAIVEGLAQRIARGEVPDLLKNVRLLALQPSSLVAGASMAGEFEKRAKAVLEEVSQDGVILFIDEVHAIIGAGGMQGRTDMASQFKPALSRGDMALIAATTDDEYRRYIEPDAALERRFQPVRVQEMSPGQTRGVMSSLRDELERIRGVRVPDDVLDWLLDFSGRFMKNRYFPDKALDLLEQCVAHAATRNVKTVDMAEAMFVGERMVGMPLEGDVRLAALRKRLGDGTLLALEDVEKLCNRLEVAFRALDVRPERANAVLLLPGEMASLSDDLACTIAETVFGSPDRVVTIDFSRFLSREDVTLLTGAPPGYVGYTDPVPLHRIAQIPWCVLRCERIDACNPRFLEILGQALGDGYFTDASGKRIYLSDTVVLLTASLESDTRRPLGFRSAESETRMDHRKEAEKILGKDFVSLVHIICAEGEKGKVLGRHWLEENLLQVLSDRYGKEGLSLKWDKSFVDFLLENREGQGGYRDLERIVDEYLGPVLMRHMPPAGDGSRRSLLVKYIKDQVAVENITGAKGEE